MYTRLKRGFTLIELLVVIAIIAILAAILFPVFAQAREKARQTVCVSDNKQMASALIMYSSDYDQRMPLSQFLDPNTNMWSDGASVPPNLRTTNNSKGYLDANAADWANAMQPYAKNYQILTCPSSTTQKKIPIGLTINTPIAISYAYNGLLCSYPIAGIVAPSQLPMMHEGVGKAFILGLAYANPQIDCSADTGPCIYKPKPNISEPICAEGNGGWGKWYGFGNTAETHGGRGMVFAYVDGHVKFKNMNTLATDTNRTDPLAEPYAEYDGTRTPNGEWFESGNKGRDSNICNPWYFRPDYDFK